MPSEPEQGENTVIAVVKVNFYPSRARFILNTLASDLIQGNEGGIPIALVHHHLFHSPTAIFRKLTISLNGGAPNIRLYSRLNWDGLS